MKNTDQTYAENLIADNKICCPRCESEDIERNLTNYTFDYGSGDKKIKINAKKVPVMSCKKCDIEFLDKHGEMIEHEAICRHFGVLTPSEIKRMREHLGYTQEGFAKLTKIGVASLVRWEKGASIQSPSNNNYLRLLESPYVIKILEDRLTKTSNKAESSQNERFQCLFGDLQNLQKILTRSERFSLTP